MSRGTRIPSRLHTRKLVKPSDVQPSFAGFEVIGTFNPAAIEFGDEVALLVRVVEQPTEIRPGFFGLPRWDHEHNSMVIDWLPLDEVDVIDSRIVRIKSSGHVRLTFISWLLPIFISGDGTNLRFGQSAMTPQTIYETFGIEDARLSKYGDRYYFTYVGVSQHGIVTALASTIDFQSFERHGIVFCPENKDVVLFPEMIDGNYVALHRPNPNAHFSSPEMWLARSPDLLHWGEHMRLLGDEAGWATVKIGGGTAPIRTRRGWLSLYHAHIGPDRDSEGIGQYVAAALLQDLGEPARVIGVSPEPIMVAEIDFELAGYLPNIVFPTALLRKNDFVDVYYGAADTTTAVTRYLLEDLLATIP